jgi:transcription termination factor NusB
MAQIDQAHRAGAEQQRRAGADQLRQQELRRTGKHDARHRHRRQRRNAALQRHYAVDHAKRSDAKQQGQHGAQAEHESRPGVHFRAGRLTRTMPPTTSAAAAEEMQAGLVSHQHHAEPDAEQGVRKENTSSRPAR